MVLVVEDSLDDQAILKRALKKTLPATVPYLVAADGAQALEMAEGLEKPPLLILLDLKLPRVNGLDVLSKLRANEKYRACPIVVMSSSTESSDVEVAYSLGATNYIQKPIEYEVYVDVIQCCVRHWLHHRIQPNKGF